MARLAEANGARYLHFLQPNQYLEGSKPISDEEREIVIEKICATIGTAHP
jgi:hypothetical protein